MGQLVLLVVAAAWAAVLLPPLLRSRVENRPNSSVTDFRRQLNRLQSTVPSRAGAPLRPVGRQLAPSPLQRPAAAGRPGAPRGGQPGRTHADPRSHHAQMSGATLRPRADRSDRTGGHHRAHRQAHVRQAHASRPGPAHDAKRRRANVLFSLVLLTAATLFLAATTKATLMLYLFALAFLALCGYVYLLAQMRQREQQRPWSSARSDDRPAYR